MVPGAVKINRFYISERIHNECDLSCIDPRLYSHKCRLVGIVFGTVIEIVVIDTAFCAQICYDGLLGST